MVASLPKFVDDKLRQGNVPDENDWMIAGAIAWERIDMSVAAGGADVAEVTIAPYYRVDGSVPVPGVRLLDVWLSDDAEGAGLTSTAASGTVTTKTDEGIVQRTHTAKKDLTIQTKSDGTAVLEITDAQSTEFYVCVRNPRTGATHVKQVLAANYGS